MSQRIEANALLGERYRLVEPVADKGMGEVWRVVDERRVGAALLLKFMRAIEGDELSPEALTAVRALKAMRHPAVPTTLAHGVFARRPWVVIDGVQGDSLGTLLDRARSKGELFDLATLRRIFDAVAGALAAAHASALPVCQGVIAPGSVIALAKPTQKAPCALLDLGLMPWLDAASDAPARSARSLVTAAPEHASGSAATVSTDVFALGALLTEMLARPADDGATLAAVTDARRRSDVPDGVWKALSVAMAAAPTSRYASVSTFTAALDTAWREALPTRSRLEAMLESHGAPPSGSLLDSVTPVQQGPSQAVGFTPPAPSSSVAPPAATKAATGGLSALVNAMPAEPNPWATEVRLREVAMPASVPGRAPATSAPNDGGTLVARVPMRALDDDGPTLVAAAPRAKSPPQNLPDVALAARDLPMNVPDGTLIATVPAEGYRAPAPVATPPVISPPVISPPVISPPTAPAPPVASTMPRAFVGVTIALITLGAIAAWWLVTRS